MKRVNSLVMLWLSAVIGAIGCSDPYNTVSISAATEKVMAERITQKIRDASTSDRPSLIVVERHSESWEQYRYLVAKLIFINPLNVPVSYRGYTPDSFETRPPKGSIDPLYQSQMKETRESKWHDCSNVFCGNGLATMAVPPNHAGQFEAAIHPPLREPEITLVKIGKVGFECTWTDSDGLAYSETIWSEEISTE
jgi:hypothetical protein